MADHDFEERYWFPWRPIRFRRKTYHLSLAEDGAYRRLIDEYMISRQPLPSNDAALARILGVPKADWDALAPKVRAFFRLRNDKLYHTHCEEELRAQNARHNRNSERGKKAALVRWSKINNIDARRMLTPAIKHNKENLISDVEHCTLGVPSGPMAEPSKKNGRLSEPASGPAPSQVGRAELETIYGKKRGVG